MTSRSAKAKVGEQRETEVKMIGLGPATAVLIDVTIVRMVLAPAVLELLGERAWWLPARWQRLIPVRTGRALGPSRI